MCRLFEVHGGQRMVSTTVWLLDAPSSLAAQSSTQPDGYGIGTFEEDGSHDVDKGPVRAAEDELFVRGAGRALAHLRGAPPVRPDRGAVGREHPPDRAARPAVLHNGVLWGLPELEERLGGHRSLVHGDTDSERLFALITREAELRGGDVEAGIRAAIEWVADHLPVFSLNFVLTTPTDLWALRHPETNDLFVCERDAGGADDHGTAGTMHVRAPELTDCRLVVVATERMDDVSGWRLLEPGELLHVPMDLCCAPSTVIDRPPAHQLTLHELDARAAASQTADTGAVAAQRRP